MTWTEETVDNEHLNKKKSKSCCIYTKPKAFGESSDESSDEEDDCSHCPSHKDGNGDASGGGGAAGGGAPLTA